MNYVQRCSKVFNIFVHLSKEIVLSKNAQQWTFAAKDNFATKKFRTTCSSKMLANFQPAYNATVIDRLTSSGATLIGKTNLDEFAMGSGTVDSIWGPTRNPWSVFLKTFSVKSNDDGDFYICGGSSGGSAAAVAAGCVDFALGSDTGGSSRCPAAHCGVVGFKPTYGWVSRHGLIPLVHSMDMPSILARTVHQVVRVFNAVGGHDELDSTTVREPAFCGVSERWAAKDLSGLCVGVPVEYNTPQLDSAVRASWEKAARLLQNAGARLVAVSLPHTPWSISCYSVLNCCEVASNMACYDGMKFGFRSEDSTSFENMVAAGRQQAFNNVVRGRILAGNYFLLKENYEDYFIRALKVRRLVTDDFLRVFTGAEQLERNEDSKTATDQPGDRCHVLLTPTTPSDAPLFSDFRQYDNRAQTERTDYFTQPANLAGIPALSIPVELSPHGLPIGLQVLGPRFGDQQVLQVGRFLEEAFSFPSQTLLDALRQRFALQPANVTDSPAMS